MTDRQALAHGSFNGRSVAVLPFKHSAVRRHRIRKIKFKATNWSEYEAGLRHRGSSTVWLTPEALAMRAAPKCKTRGGQPRYSDLAIETALFLDGSSHVKPLLDQIGRSIEQFTADGAYDGKPTCDAINNHSVDAAIDIPPRINAVDPTGNWPLGQRDLHIAAISSNGRMKRQASTGCGKRARVETAIGRYCFFAEWDCRPAKLAR